jgi:uncharacterized UBP type Zn finger protein
MKFDSSHLQKQIEINEDNIIKLEKLLSQYEGKMRNILLQSIDGTKTIIDIMKNILENELDDAKREQGLL